MKAFVLAAGLGTRLRPLTDTYAKPALPLAHKPMLRRVLERLVQAGIKEIRVNSHHLPETVEEVIADSGDLGATLSSQFEPELLGTGGALLASREWLDGECVLVVNGDAVSDLNFADLVASHQSSSRLATMALREPSPGETFGPVETDVQDRVVRILDNGPPLAGTKTRMFCGIHILEPSFLDLLEPKGFSCVVRRGYLAALERGETVGSFLHQGYFADAGTPGSFLDAHWHVLRGEYPSGFGTGPCASSSTSWWLESDIEFGDGVSLGDKVSVGRGACLGEGAYLEDCLLESGATVEPSERLVGAIRLSSGTTLFRN